MDQINKQILYDKLKSINIEWLKYFVVLAELKNISDAAEAIGISHQLLSKVVLKLEDILETTLIHKNHRKKRLTQQGELFYRFSLELLNSICFINTSVSGIISEKPIKIGFDPLAHTIIDSLFESFFVNHSKYNYEVYTTNEDRLISYVRIGEFCDIGFTFSLPPKDINYIKLCETKLVIVNKENKGKNWKELGYIKPKALSSEIDNEEMTKIFHLEQFYQKHNLKIVCTVNAFTTLIEFVNSGIASGILPEIAVENEIKTKKLNVINCNVLNKKITLYLIYNKATIDKPASKKFIEYVRNKFSIKNEQ